MIVVDTSVWVAALRGLDARVVRQVGRLLDDDAAALVPPARLELLSGASGSQQALLKRVLSALPVFYPSEAIWNLLEGWIERAVTAGQRFGIGDLLIAGVAHENRLAVWSLDSDFARMARLGFVELYKP